MISPPLMFVTVLLPLALQLLALSLVHDGCRRVARSKRCRRLAHAAAVRSPHLIRIWAVLVGDVVSRSWFYCAQNPRRWEQRRTVGHLRTTGSRGPADKLNWCRVRKYHTVPAVCFPNSRHAHRATKRDGLLWDGRAASHKVASRSQSLNNRGTDRSAPFASHTNKRVIVFYCEYPNTRDLDLLLKCFLVL